MAVTPTPAPAGPTPMSTSQLMGMKAREFILLAGKDGAGKSCALVAIAKFVQDVLDPAAKFYVIDTENKFPTALRSFGPEAPTNIVYYKTETMNEVNEAADAVFAARKPGDWLGVESMSRVWEKAQDMGYMAVSGYDKAVYLEKRRELAAKVAKAQVPVVVPKPDQLWNVVKGAHDSAFLDIMANASSLNVVLSTTIAKPPKETGAIKENATRKEVRAEFGIDVGIDGAPRLPYYVETMLLMDMEAGVVNCRVIRDNLSPLEQSRVSFNVDGKKMFGMAFWSNCRG